MIKFKKKNGSYSALLLNTFSIAIVVIGTVTAARITPNTASSDSMFGMVRKGCYYTFFL